MSAISVFSKEALLENVQVVDVAVGGTDVLVAVGTAVVGVAVETLGVGVALGFRDVGVAVGDHPVVVAVAVLRGFNCVDVGVGVSA
jgi:hypothetical protein